MNSYNLYNNLITKYYVTIRKIVKTFLLLLIKIIYTEKKELQFITTNLSFLTRKFIFPFPFVCDLNIYFAASCFLSFFYNHYFLNLYVVVHI